MGADAGLALTAAAPPAAAAGRAHLATLGGEPRAGPEQRVGCSWIGLWGVRPAKVPRLHCGVGLRPAFPEGAVATCDPAGAPVEGPVARPGRPRGGWHSAWPGNH